MREESVGNSNLATISMVAALFSVLIFLGFVAFSVYLDKQGNVNDSLGVPQSLTEQALESVQRHFFLKDTSSPKVAKVLDAESAKKKDPTFFADVKNGDILLIVDGKVILYRPSVDRIINVSEVKVNKSTKIESVKQKQEQIDYRKVDLKLKIAVLNGSDDIKATTKIVDSVKRFNDSLQLQDIGIAKRDFEKATVYDKSQDSDAVKALAEFLGFEYSKDFPEDVTTDADVLIVAGFDKFPR